MELLHEEGRRDPAQPDRAGDAQHLLPPVENPGPPDAPTDIRLKARIALHVEGSGGVEALPSQITQAWGEPEAHQIKERKDDLRIAMGVRRMLDNGELRFVIAQLVEHIRGIPDRCWNRFGTKL